MSRRHFTKVASSPRYGMRFLPAPAPKCDSWQSIEEGSHHHDLPYPKWHVGSTPSTALYLQLLDKSCQVRAMCPSRRISQSMRPVHRIRRRFICCPSNPYPSKWRRMIPCYTHTLRPLRVPEDPFTWTFNPSLTAEVEESIRLRPLYVLSVIQLWPHQPSLGAPNIYQIKIMRSGINWLNLPIGWMDVFN